ncbi:peptide deformylase [Candidatus Pacearchaeota archaeon]|jgi:peptide deformylase|nr:peptide deformylase [Candidatus Pacearchaeota archaeon]
MIITDESLLRVKCELVLPSEVDDLRAKLEEGLAWAAKHNRVGVGLACPQIGIAKEMAIIRVEDIKIDLVNAKIAKKYYQFEFDGEGCLSFPGRYEKTLRYKEIVVEGNLVHPHRFIATGFAAVVISHELDHLNGILLPDAAIAK